VSRGPTVELLFTVIRSPIVNTIVYTVKLIGCGVPVACSAQLIENGSDVQLVCSIRRIAA